MIHLIDSSAVPRPFLSSGITHPVQTSCTKKGTDQDGNPDVGASWEMIEISDIRGEGECAVKMGQILSVQGQNASQHAGHTLSSCTVQRQHHCSFVFFFFWSSYFSRLPCSRCRLNPHLAVLLLTSTTGKISRNSIQNTSDRN